MPILDRTILKDFFGGGIARDDKSPTLGAVSNIEEVDIFSNKDYVQAEQVMSAETLPASSEAYAHTVDPSDTVWIYGKETSGSKVRIMKVTTGGADNPGNPATHITSADATNLAYELSPIEFHQTTESSTNYVYFLVLATNTVKLARLELGAGSDFTVVGTLTGLSNSYDRVWIRRLFGELYVSNGRYVAHVDGAGTFTEKRYTLPNGWKAVASEGLSDSMLLLCKSDNRLLNYSMIYQWDLTAASQFDDSIKIPMGGPQWIENHKEAIRVCCAINGRMKLYQLSGSFPFVTHDLSNIAAETTNQPISPAKGVCQREGVLYFTVYKTDKTGIYALGQVTEASPVALVLAKRFIPSGTTAYSTHKPISLFIHGPNFYATYYATSTASASRCESNNTPDRSSDAIIETLIVDDGKPLQDKSLIRAYVCTYPLAASTSIALSIAADYSASYTEIKRADNTAFNSANGLFGLFRPAAFTNKKNFRAKIAFTSSGSSSPKLTAIGLRMQIKPVDNG